MKWAELLGRRARLWLTLIFIIINIFLYEKKTWLCKPVFIQWYPQYRKNLQNNSLTVTFVFWMVRMLKQNSLFFGLLYVVLAFDTRFSLFSSQKLLYTINRVFSKGKYLLLILFLFTLQRYCLIFYMSSSLTQFCTVCCSIKLINDSIRIFSPAQCLSESLTGILLHKKRLQYFVLFSWTFLSLS